MQKDKHKVYMESSILYAVSVTGLIVFFTCRQIAMTLAAKCRHGFRSRLQYPLVYRRGKNTHSVTRLDALLLALYLGTNGVVLGWAVGSQADLARRAAFTSLVNLTPLFFGGRTNPLMSFVGLPLPKYYLAHHWFGRVAIAEALLHAGLSASQNPSATASTVSGYVVRTLRPID